MEDDNKKNRRAYFVDILVKRITEEKEHILTQWQNPTDTSTRHFVVDELLPVGDVKQIYGAFPRDGKGFFDMESFREKKKTSAKLNNFAPILRDITYAFQAEEVVSLIEGILSLKHIEADSQLYAGGLSMMTKGDYLNPHIDNSHDGERERYRRLNLLYYVSPNWLEGNGGNFELWNDNGKIPKVIVSSENRLVVMETNRHSLHSVNAVTAEQFRCCVSNYYFSKVSPDEGGKEYFHVTSFSGRPEQPLRRLFGGIDNSLRNSVAKLFKVGRGKNWVNKD
jgi:Rps23 Pro-64 3,4-dihydroxylase Tpa1-like proline 4-hydroxylase